MATFFFASAGNHERRSVQVTSGQHEGGVGIFGQLLGPFFGFCTEKLRFFGFVVRCSFRFSVLFAIRNKGGKIPL